MHYDPFRPHWKHKQCGGVVTGSGDIYKCSKCKVEGSRLGAILPPDVTNRLDYFASHSELEVEFVDEESSPISTPAQSCANSGMGALGKVLRWAWQNRPITRWGPPARGPRGD
jgi:hypothetical protein